MAAMGGSVARRYAKALFGLGVDSNSYDRFGQELEDLVRVYEASAGLMTGFSRASRRSADAS